jgi:hypothetical protein
LSHLDYESSTVFANLELLRVQSGTHPELDANVKLMAAAKEGMHQAMEYNSDRANPLAWLQLYFCIAGVVAYVVWHLLQMYMNAPHD